MKSYISRKFPVETITTDLIFDDRSLFAFNECSGSYQTNRKTTWPMRPPGSSVLPLVYPVVT